MRTTDLIRSIRSQLGQDQSYGVAVEVSDAQITHSIRLALEEYGRYFPVRTVQSFTAHAGMYVYTPNPAIRGVTQVMMVPELEAQLSSPEAALLGGRLSTLGSSFQFGSPYAWAIYKRWKDVAETVMSSKPNWHYEPSDGKVYLYCPTQGYKITVIGSINTDTAFDEEEVWEETDDPLAATPSTPKFARLDNALANVPQNHFQMLRGLARAKTKETLGYMRRKYSSIPGTDRDLQMDGQALVSEGMQEWKEIVQDMRKRTPALVPSIG